MDSCQDLAVFLRRCAHYLQSQYYSPVVGRAWNIRDNLWTNLQTTGAAYVNQASSLTTLAWDVAVVEVLKMLQSAIIDALPALKCFVDALRVAQPRSHVSHKSELQSISIGAGGPGRLGCADISGRKICWSPIVNRDCGALHTMDKLQLELIALPGVRLAANCKILVLRASA